MDTIRITQRYATDRVLNKKKVNSRAKEERIWAEERLFNNKLEN